MKIPQTLAELIARAAIGEPYRQIDVMHTWDFVSWLRARGIRLQWQTIHHLWSVGILHPIAVLGPAVSAIQEADGRFLQVDVGGEGPTYVDLGVEVTEDTPLRPSWRLAQGLERAVLWHPFQLWQFSRLADALEMNIALDVPLSGLEVYCRLAEMSVSSVQKRVMAHGQSDRIHNFLRVLGLQLLAEPLVHTTINSRVRTLPHLDESFEGYFAWIEQQDGAGMLEVAGLSLSEVEQWHRDIAIQAQIEDPVAVFRVLFRHANRDRRIRLEDAALRSHDLYDAAEVLRRYCEQYHGQHFLEEDDVRHGPRGPAVKQRLYGAARTADFDRRVFRRVAREFGMDPQARTTWFVEGNTEDAFIRRMAERLHLDLNSEGIELMNLGGVGGLGSDRLLGLLERLQREEVFAFVSVDRDNGGNHLRQLKSYAARNLLAAGFRMWEPDFEVANFTLDELAQVASGIATVEGVPLTVSAEDISRVMEERKLPAGEAIKRLWSSAWFFGGKGAVWGRALADWAADLPCPPDRADDVGERPIISLLLRLLRGQESHYPATVELMRVADDGELVARTEQSDQAAE